MIIEFTAQADADFDYLKKSGNMQIISKIKELMKSIKNDPYNGIGKPEPLKYNLSSSWSRRINREHRLVYKVEGEIVYIISFRGHY